MAAPRLAGGLTGPTLNASGVVPAAEGGRRAAGRQRRRQRDAIRTHS